MEFTDNTSFRAWVNKFPSSEVCLFDEYGEYIGRPNDHVSEELWNFHAARRADRAAAKQYSNDKRARTRARNKARKEANEERRRRAARQRQEVAEMSFYGPVPAGLQALRQAHGLPPLVSPRPWPAAPTNAAGHLAPQRALPAFQAPPSIPTHPATHTASSSRDSVSLPRAVASTPTRPQVATPTSHRIVQMTTFQDVARWSPYGPGNRLG